MGECWLGSASGEGCRVMMRLAVATAVLVGIWAQPCFGGGSDELVSIEKFQVLNSTDYVLVVLPKPLAAVPLDWFMGGCVRFTVHGTYTGPSAGCGFIIRRTLLARLTRARFDF